LEYVSEGVGIVRVMIGGFELKALSDACLQGWLQASEEASGLFDGGNATFGDKVARD
jgi:hypothetical protein